SRFAAALATRISGAEGAVPGETSAASKTRDLVPKPAFPMGSDVLILIPARMASARLPGKPLADIGGLPMIVRVMRRAEEAAVGHAVMTRNDHATGSDRIFEALGIADPGERANIVINVQGDFPMLAPSDIKAALGPLADPAVDIATLALEITEDAERTDPNVVKAICSPVAPGRFRALYFTRTTAPTGE